MKISIAMATFNGERYLQEQLESLRAQTSLPDELVVTDDGSTDETIPILERFRTSAPFPVRIYRNERNLGFADNFLKAARLCTGDWVAFCDQDDVWYPEKLLTVEQLASEQAGVVLVAHASRLVDETLNDVGGTWPARPRKSQIWGPGRSPLYFYASGFSCSCARVLVSASAYASPPPNWMCGTPDAADRLSHDQLICALAPMAGSIAFTEKVLADYRRHGATVSSRDKIGAHGARRKRGWGFGRECSFYREQGRIASRWASFYADYSSNGGDWVNRKAAAKLAVRYGCVALALELRAGIYENGVGRLHRASDLLRLVRLGEYTAPDHSILTWKSLLKDAVWVLLPGMLSMDTDEAASGGNGCD